MFALTNTTDKPIERWLAADRYDTVGSGVVWPDLDARRVDAVTPSVGYVPERIKNDRADVFRLTLEPGQTVTFVAELASERFARLYLWKPIEYEQKSRDRQLFNGIMLGITGLLAIFLTAVFAANHKAIFPTAAIFTWCVLAYLCVDFGFWHKLFNVRPEENAQYRAATEAGMAATLLIFLYTFLRLGAWHGFVRMLLGLWVTAQLVLVAVAFLDPRLAATFARLSSVAIAGVGAALTLFLALRGQDRALSLVPTWMLLLVWLFGAGVTFTGRLSGDIVVFGLTAGLVLIVVLIGFTVTQYAFRSFEPLYGAAARRAAAALARRRRRRRRGLGMARAPRRDQGQPGRGGDAGPQGRRALGQDRRASPSTCIPPTASASSCCWVGEGARGRRDAHRVPHAPRRQLLPLVRARGGERAQPPTAATCAASAWCARSRTPSARRSGCCTMPCTTASPACPTASCSSTAWRSPPSAPRWSRWCGRRCCSSTSTSSRPSTPRSASSSATACC